MDMGIDKGAGIRAKVQFIVAVAAFGTIGFFVKNIDLPSAEIALYRGIIALIFLSAYLFLSGGFHRLKGGRKNLFKMFVSGAAMGFNWILLFEAYNYTSVALSTLSYYFAPVIVIILSSFLFHEKLTIKQLICFLISTAGLVLIVGVSGKGEGSNDFLGILLGLGAAVLYAFVVLNNKSMGETDGIARTVFQFLSAVIVLLPYVILNGGFHIRSMNTSGFINLIIVGAFHTGFVYYLYFSSMGYLKGQEVAVLSYIDPLIAIIVSVFLLGESISIVQIAGGAAILLAALVNEFSSEK